MDAVLKRLHQRVAASANLADGSSLFGGRRGFGLPDRETVDTSALKKVAEESKNENDFARENHCEEMSSCSDETSCNEDVELDVGINIAQSRQEQRDLCSMESEAENQGTSSSVNVSAPDKPKQGKEGFLCELCSKSFKWPMLLQSHIDKKHPEAPKKCEQCGKKFSWSCQLPSHSCRPESKALVPSRHECPVCGKGFPRATALIQHRAEHPELQTYTCSPCKRSYSHRAHLISHLREIHGEDSPEYAKYKEELLKKRKSKGKDIRNKIRRFPCRECGKVFKQAIELAGHLNWHTGEKPYQCEQCGKAFSSKSNLGGHRRYVHDNERPYTCSVCSESFKKADTLKKHMRLHTGEKPFSCDLCEKTFTQKAALTKHMVIHTKARPCKCDICGVTYPWRQSLRQHLAKCHPGMAS